MNAKLVTNRDGKAPPVSRFGTLTSNFLPKLVRHDRMEDRDYLVVPMVILTEGVHNGSDGPLYYPEEELSRTPESWNQKPVVVYHPQINGKGVSACSPDIVSSRKVGVMMNTRWEGKKLKSEAWLEEARVKKVDERILEFLESNTPMELSTGVFLDTEEEAGTWNDEEYVGIARNYRADHLALLPDKVGACSLADGAGLLRNEKGKKDKTKGGTKDCRSENILVDGEMSFSNIQSALTDALRKKLGEDSYPWIASVYSTFVIYEFNGGLFKIGYTAGESGVSLSEGDPVPVVRVTEYRTAADGTFVGNDGNKEQTNMNKTKKELVDAIIGNKGWTDANRETLMAFSDEQLTLIGNAVHPPEPPKVAPAPAAPAAPVAPAPTPAPAVNAEPAKVVTLESYITNAPPALQDVLRNSVAMHNEEKAKIVAALLANKACPFTEADLSNRPLGELRGLAALAGSTAKTTANYEGMAPTAPTGNEEPVLEVPALNFAK